MGGNKGSRKSRASSHETRVPSFPLAELLQPARGTVSTWTILSCILMVIGLFRWSVGFWGFSGYQKPPMYGDFEAQRHWIEITSHLPLSQWYFHDLEWWGLDYPPLTAYHSWIMGKIGNLIDPSWFALHTSRGLESQDLKVFMRATVIVSEFLTYIPAMVICVRRLARLQAINTWDSAVALTAVLMQPSTMLIDHGHFQYNTVMLGFVVATAAALYSGRHGRACIWFVASLGFKQMALFYAPAIFAYLLGVCVFARPGGVARFLEVSVCTIFAFGILVMPLLLGSLYDNFRKIDLPFRDAAPPLLQYVPVQITTHTVFGPMAFQLAQAIHRIFPFARGVFEDKVANIWCAIHSSGLYKLNRSDPTMMGRCALALTCASILPGCILTFLRPKKDMIPWSLATCSWGFFLASYQVHEKNVLLPLLPMTLLLAGHKGLDRSIRAWVGYANILGAWTLFPLLERDDLRIPYAVLTLLWAWLLGLPPVSLEAYRPSHASPEDQMMASSKLIHLSTYAIMVTWHVAKAISHPPDRLPDLFVVGNVCVGCVGFGICYLWCLWNLAVRSGLLPKALAGYRDKMKEL